MTDNRVIASKRVLGLGDVQDIHHNHGQDAQPYKEDKESCQKLQ